MNQLETDPNAQRSQPEPQPAWMGRLAGVAAAVLALCVGQLIAALLNVVSPFGAIGSEFIDRTPKWLKELAISWFGVNDKAALRAGMAITILLLAAYVGVAARKTPRVGNFAMYAFASFGALVAIGRPGEGIVSVVPALFAAVTGATLLQRLLKAVRLNDPAAAMPSVQSQPRGRSRRQFMQTAGTAAVGAIGASVAASQITSRRATQTQRDALNKITANGTKLGNVVSEAPPIPANSTLSPITPFITPNKDFYRIDTAFSAPRVDLNTWAVNIGGRVDRPMRLTYEDLLKRPQVERVITICCVSNEVGGNLIGNAVWQGVLLADLLEEAGVQPEATQVFGTSVDGWTCGFPVQLAMDGRDAMIALLMNGEQLPINHGFPARMIVPGLYGYISATKWLSNIDLTTWDEAVGYWIPRGWSRDAPVKTQSRIDVPRSGDTITRGTTPIAGIAWAQHRGVAKVEVRVDDGAWMNAKLSDDLTDDVWRQWIVEWDATPGEHVIQVRATDRNGDTQTEKVARVDPDGATGYHTRTVTVRA
jgi:DMSO/TMAO reductase YedYZ molybdopterin-dependent catalytic subunit